jgi:hypothetical protein
VNKNLKAAVLLCASLLIAVFVICGTLLMYKRTPSGSSITATGSAKFDFESNLIVWKCSYMVHGDTLEQAYEKINHNEKLVNEYLQAHEITGEEVLFGSVDIERITNPVYDEAGHYVGTSDAGYDLKQVFVVSSDDLDKVENIFRNISELIASGIELESHSPQYYYTQLDELKMGLIDAASANARERVRLMTKNTGAKPGKLTTASLGVFQITPLNSGTDGYGATGTLDTSSRYKTAMITVKLSYMVR